MQQLQLGARHAVHVAGGGYSRAAQVLRAPLRRRRPAAARACRVPPRTTEDHTAQLRICRKPSQYEDVTEDHTAQLKICRKPSQYEDATAPPALHAVTGGYDCAARIMHATLCYWVPPLHAPARGQQLPFLLPFGQCHCSLKFTCTACRREHGCACHAPAQERLLLETLGSCNEPNVCEACEAWRAWCCVAELLRTVHLKDMEPTGSCNCYLIHPSGRRTAQAIARQRPRLRAYDQPLRAERAAKRVARHLRTCTRTPGHTVSMFLCTIEADGALRRTHSHTGTAPRLVRERQH